MHGALRHRRKARIQRRRLTSWGGIALAVILMAGGGTGISPDPAKAQVVENNADPFLFAIPYPRVRLLHSEDKEDVGTSAYLRSFDPFLFYQYGRDLTQIQFKLEHGAYGDPGGLNVPLYVGSRSGVVHGLPARFARDHSASCAMCHSSVFREPAGGHTIGSTGGLGRNTTHFFGAGLIEMLGEQMRQQILSQYDENQDGWIDRNELAESMPVQIRPGYDAPAIDYGNLAPDASGIPQLNSLFRLWYVDAQGKTLPDALSLADEKVAGFGFAPQPFGWGRGRIQVDGRSISQGGESSTTREFFTVAADFHMGMQAYDPTQQGDDPSTLGAGGLAKVSLNGAQQYNFGGSPDPGKKLSTHGYSLDDPDRDGHFVELTEGDIDAVEFFLLHAPTPTVRPTETSESGRLVMRQTGCLRCHVENWRILPKNEERGLKGDRRFFHLEARAYLDDQNVTQLYGQLERRDRSLPDGSREPLYGGFKVERVYTDFKHWDVGPLFHERRFDGSLQKTHRTAPLWGVGSTAPYGHAGNFMTLHEVITAHGGEAQPERDAYRRLSSGERELLLDYLRSLVLYSTDDIQADIDGDGKINPQFKVAGQDVGYERFDARFLFKTAPRYYNIGQAVHPSGRAFPLAFITNIQEAYGLDLPFRRDDNSNGFPDLIEEPQTSQAPQGGQP